MFECACFGNTLSGLLNHSENLWKDMSKLKKQMVRKNKNKNKKLMNEAKEFEALAIENDNVCDQIIAKQDEAHKKKSFIKVFYQLDTNMDGTLDDCELERFFAFVGDRQHEQKICIELLGENQDKPISLRNWIKKFETASTFEMANLSALLNENIGATGRFEIDTPEQYIMDLGDKIREMQEKYNVIEADKTQIYTQIKTIRNKKQKVYSDQINNLKTVHKKRKEKKKSIFDKGVEERKTKVKKQFEEPLQEYDEKQEKSKESFQQELKEAEFTFQKKMQDLEKKQNDEWRKQEINFQDVLNKHNEENEEDKRKRKDSCDIRIKNIEQKFDPKLNPIKAKQNSLEKKERKVLRKKKELKGRLDARKGVVKQKRWNPDSSESIEAYGKF